MSRRLFSLAALAFAAGTALGADTTPATASKGYEFGVIAKSQSNPVFQAARTGAMDAAADLSKKHGIEIKVIWQTPVNEDAQQQAQYIEQLASLGVDGIAISCTDANVLTKPIDGAVGKGVQVVTFDSDAPKSKRFAYYGIDDVEAGKKLMDELAKAMGGKGGQIAILAGNQSAPNLQARVKGVKDQIEKLKDKGFTLKEVYYHEETPGKAAAKVQEVQTANPDIAGWAMVGGWPLFTKGALEGVYDKAKVAAVDALPEQIEYVKSGQVQALVVQDCYGWGYKSVEMLFDKVHNGKNPEKVINAFELKVCTQANASEYEGLWKKWLAKKDDKKEEKKDDAKPASDKK
ncbi:MAG: sugar ABC transporter substrate-binding protein [Tepidisphaera sp.]